MATELVSFEVQKLWDLLSQEYQQFQGVDDQVTELKSDLNLLKSFLKDADAKKHTSSMVRNCMEEIKEIVYDAEDIIETFLLKKELQKGSGFKMRLRRLAFPIVDRREIASNMEGISTRISKVIEDMKIFGVQQIVIDGGYMQPLHDRQREIRQTYPSDHEIKLVGLEENVEKLVGYLVEEDCFQVVSITGMDGIGKTTLARQVFNHDMVKNQFDRLAWVCVSQDFTRKHVWETILQNLKPKEEEVKILQMTEPTLQDELFRLLETSRSLIVLDDIWKEEDWDQIKAIFPPKKGWKVVLTSRNETVTGHGNTTYINFKPEGLTIEDSWTLFQSIAFPRNYSPELKVDEEMEELGKKMIDHCGGLPLAVKLLGGLLATKYTLHDWKRVSDNIGYHILGRANFNEGNNTSVYNVLSVSFEELPSYLKHCFLYLAHFPKDYEIDVEKLSYYWAAEGIPKPRYYEGMTIRDVADGYIEELVMRNMVIAERDINTSRFETCRLHERMREVCMFKAKEENFLHIITRLSSISYVQSPCTSRRIVFQYPDTVEVERSINNPKIRSFLIMPDMLDYCLMPSSLSFTRLQLLRVLDLSTVEFEGGKLPSSIGKLIHLRYLSLKDAKVFHIPSSLRNLKLLIYLNLDVSSVPISVPNVFMEMLELRYLALPSMIKSIKLKLSNLVNLETLENLSTWNSSLEDLHRMVRLTSLFIIITDETYIENISAAIRGLRRLEDLSILDRGSSKMITQRFVLDFIYLKELQLSIYMPRLPEERHFPSNLITISLRQCCLEEDPFPILEKLLHLKEVHLWFRSFSGRRMVCSSGGFPQLRELMFCALEELEEWIVEEGSMPLLHTLHISYCNMLKELPAGLRFIYSLKDMRIGEEWKERLSEGGEDCYKVQHVPSIIFERNIFS